jgi:hypothetical protein
MRRAFQRRYGRPIDQKLSLGMQINSDNGGNATLQCHEVAMSD